MSKDKDSMSIYAPIRLRSTPQWQYSLGAAKQGMITADGMIAKNLPNFIHDELVLPCVRLFVEACDTKEQAGEMLPIYYAKIVNLRHWVPIIGQYELCGRQIFDLEPRLIEMFSNTDVGEATLEKIHFPYECFYVRFGKQEQIKLPYEDEFEYLEGAFVARANMGNGESRLRFGFTTVLENGDGLTTPGYYIDLMPDEQKMEITKAIDSALARKERELIGNAEEDKAICEARVEHLKESVALLKGASSLIINTLFYLENIKDCLPPKKAGRDTPVNLLPGKGVKEHKVESKLFANGYSMVRLIGSEYENHEDGVLHGSKSAHWRRGHWRDQRYGEKNKLIKRIWMKPTRIGVGSIGNPPEKGHIYTT